MENTSRRAHAFIHVQGDTISKSESKSSKKAQNSKKEEKKQDSNTDAGHVLVPKHEVISKEDVKNLLKELRIDDVNLLPKIEQNDAALSNLNVKKGDVIKITRKSVTAGTSIYYRVVY